jgi:hypothetical protein
METKFKLDKFSLYLDLGFTPKEVATLSITLDYRKEEFIRKISEARKLLCTQARPEEMEDIYRWMYDNIELFAKDEEGQDKAVLIIKQGLVDHSFVADPEINLSATLIKLGRLQ